MLENIYISIIIWPTWWYLTAFNCGSSGLVPRFQSFITQKLHLLPVSDLVSDSYLAFSVICSSDDVKFLEY